jgi:hypothetical protein
MRAFIALGVLMLLGGVQAARAEVIWRGDFETGDITQWTKPQEVSPDRLQVVDSPARQGKHALRVEVRQGDNPIQGASGNRAELVWSPVEQEGNDRYYGWSTLWPAEYPSDDAWQVFTQWHQTGDTGSPPLVLYVKGEQMVLHIGGDPGETVWTHPLERGKWHDFILHAKWSSDPGVGYVELWYDGQQVLGKTTGANMFPGQGNIMKQGLYRNDSISNVGVMYHDGMTAATTLADVQSGAAAPAAGSADTQPSTAPAAPGATGGTQSQPDPAAAAGTGATAAATDGSQAPAGSGGCSAAGATGRHGFGGASGLALALLGIAVALRRVVRRKRARTN